MTFEEILQEYNIPTAPESHHHVTQGWVQFDCPWCGKDTHKYHMGYSIEGKYITCWRCGFHPLVKTITELTDLPYHQVKKLLDDIDDRPFKKTKQPKGNYQPPKGINVMGQAHRKYLTKRGFACSEIEQLWNVEGIGLTAKYRWSLFIPIYYHGKAVSWTTRSISDNSAGRYVNAPKEEEAMPLKSLLYGEDYARQAIVICEGPTDVWRIGPGAVCTFGIGYSQAQQLRMIQYDVRVVCFDSDKRAQERANRLTDNLSAFKGETYNYILDEGDPGSMSTEEVKKLRKQFLD